jgi:hypothetical protein
MDTVKKFLTILTFLGLSKGVDLTHTKKFSSMYVGSSANYPDPRGNAQNKRWRGTAGLCVCPSERYVSEIRRWISIQSDTGRHTKYVLSESNSGSFQSNRV